MKLKNKIWMWVTSIITLLTFLTIGGLFASGTTLNFPLLRFIPAIIHTILGWSLIAIGIIQFLIVLIVALMKALK